MSELQTTFCVLRLWVLSPAAPIVHLGFAFLVSRVWTVWASGTAVTLVESSGVDPNANRGGKQAFLIA